MSTHLLRASVLLATTAACTVATSGIGPRPSAGPGPAPVTRAPAAAPGPAPACVDPGERDFADDLDRPTPLGPDSTTVGCLDRSDRDLFQVTAPPSAAGTLLTYRFAGSGPLTPDLEILDQNRRRIFTQHAGRGEQGRGWIHVAGGTSVYLRLHENFTPEPSSYILELASTPVVDATEPASSPETAKAIGLGVTVEGVMSRALNQPADERDDWFVVDLPAPGPLTIELDMSQGVKPQLFLFDGNRKRLAAEYGDPGERITLAREVKAAGRYYVQVSTPPYIDAAKAGEVPAAYTRPYRLTVRR